MVPPAFQLCRQQSLQSSLAPLCFHTLHPVVQEILSVPSSKYIQNSPTSPIPHGHTLVLSTLTLSSPGRTSVPASSTFLKSSTCPLPHLSFSKETRRSLSQIKLLPPLLRTIPWRHEVKDRRKGCRIPCFDSAPPSFGSNGDSWGFGQIHQFVHVLPSLVPSSSPNSSPILPPRSPSSCHTAGLPAVPPTHLEGSSLEALLPLRFAPTLDPQDHSLLSCTSAEVSPP